MTREGWALAAFTAGALAVGLLGGNNGIVLVGGLLVGVWVVEGVLGRWNLRGLDVGRRLPSELFAEVEGRGVLRIGNRRRRGASYALYAAEEGHDDTVGGAAHVAAGADAEVPVGWRFDGRGVGRLDALRISSDWPFGLVVRARRIPLPAEVLVWPRPRTGTATEAPDPDPGDRDEGPRSGPWGDFAGLRPYQSGDRARAIHWPTSARMRETLVVARHEAATDCVRIRVPVRRGRAWEDALSAACGEVVRAFRQGHAVGLELPDRALDPRPGGGWRRVLLDALAREPERP